jgi:hypothetical protein
LFAPFYEEVCVQRGSKADVGLVAVDEHSWRFSFADAEDTFDILAAGFRELGMLK